MSNTNYIITSDGSFVSESDVAKRGEIGVFMALSNAGYDPNQYKQGVYSSGRIAYRKDHANKIDV